MQSFYSYQQFIKQMLVLGSRQTSLDLHLLTNLLGGFQQDLTSVLPPYFDDRNKEGLVIISEAKCDQVLAICQALFRLSHTLTHL